MNKIVPPLTTREQNVSFIILFVARIDCRGTRPPSNPASLFSQNKSTHKGCFYFVLAAQKRYFLRKPCIVLNPRDFFFVRQRHFISLLLLYHIIDDSFFEFRIINTFLHKQKSPIKVQLPSWVICINVYSSIYRLIYFFTVFENDFYFIL